MSWNLLKALEQKAKQNCQRKHNSPQIHSQNIMTGGGETVQDFRHWPCRTRLNPKQLMWSLGSDFLSTKWRTSPGHHSVQLQIPHLLLKSTTASITTIQQDFSNDKSLQNCPERYLKPKHHHMGYFWMGLGQVVHATNDMAGGCDVLETMRSVPRLDWHTGEKNTQRSGNSSDKATNTDLLPGALLLCQTSSETHFPMSSHSSKNVFFLPSFILVWAHTWHAQGLLMAQYWGITLAGLRGPDGMLGNEPSWCYCSKKQGIRPRSQKSMGVNWLLQFRWLANKSLSVMGPER